MVDGGTQCSVWSRLLNLCGINVIPSNLAVNKAAQKRPSLELQIPSNNVGVVLLEPPFVPSVISEGVDRILFRELGVGRVVRVLGGCMAAVRYLEEGKSGEINPASAVNVNTGDAMQLEDDAQKDTKWISDFFHFTKNTPTTKSTTNYTTKFCGIICGNFHKILW